MTLISWKARHPERHAHAAAKQADLAAGEPDETAAQNKPIAKRRWPKRSLRGAKSSGRDRKDALMVKARELAASGVCTGWTHLLDIMASDDEDAAALRLWASAHDKDEIDLICARRRAAGPARSR